MDKTTITVDGWQFKRIDPLNWQLFERKTKTKGKNAGETAWVARPNYFASLRNAIEFARNREFDRKGDFESFDAVLAEMREIDAKFVRDIEKAIANV